MAVDTRDRRGSVLNYIPSPAPVFPNPDNSIGASNRSFLAKLYNWDLAYTPAGGYDDDRAAWIGMGFPFIRVWAEPDATISEYDRGQILGLLRRVELGATYATITGVGLTQSLGTLSTQIDVSVTPQGNALSLSLGSYTITGDAVANPIGVAITTSAGYPTVDAGSSFAWWNGFWWNGAYWNQNWWSTAVETTVILNGVDITESVGDFTVTGDSSVTLTGVGVTESLGSLSIITPTDTTVILQGIPVAISVGDLSVSAGATVSLAGEGVEITTSVGTLSAVADSISIELTGVNIAYSVGSLSASGDATTAITGVEMNLIVENMANIFSGYQHETTLDNTVWYERDKNWIYAEQDENWVSYEADETYLAIEETDLFVTTR